MAESELTSQILKDIRTEIRGLREDQRVLAEQQRGFTQHLQAFAEHQQGFAEQVMQRFEVLETTLRDLAQQLVILGRGVKVAIEARRATDDRLDDHERRLEALEQHLSAK